MANSHDFNGCNFAILMGEDIKEKDEENIEEEIVEPKEDEPEIKE